MSATQRRERTTFARLVVPALCLLGSQKQPHSHGKQECVHFVFQLKMVPIKVAIAISIAIGFVFLFVYFSGGGMPPEK